jgi:hypothetical protein
VARPSIEDHAVIYAPATADGAFGTP